MSQEPTNVEILKVITEGQKRTDGRIDKIDERFDKVDKHIADVLEVVNDFSTKMDGRMDKLDGRMDKLDKDVTAIKATMVDKDHLEDRLAKYHGDLVVLMRKEDIKVRALVEVLREKQVLTDLDVKRLISMEPFPQLSV